ncbi:hypothetical protein [Alkalihalobacillus trypoxylicola]|uniref:Uncharacterized protein n=1 Tax=Alkalihalobacillus trypoxylicola TaxID=519424 RepID=A0A161P9A4_9BACI|nr:hypothetical protein [Alkalihalobacillus trypoxylicola]KYG27610.1 hypothetical protein AZF04_10465 [Alkalihalobacillus trypoxylicola]
MSSNNGNFLSIVYKQWKFKISANNSFFSSLLWIQIIGILLSSVMNTSMFSSSLVSVEVINANIVIVFTFIWGFIIGNTLTSKANRYEDFTYVSNKLSQLLSNICFLLTASVIGGVTAFLSGYVIRIVKMILLSDMQLAYVSADSLIITFAGIIATISYVWLFSAFGYFVGILVHWHKLFIIIIPSFFIAILILSQTPNQLNGFLAFMGDWFFMQQSFLLFVVAILVSITFFFSISLLVSNRLEVRD